MLTYRKKKYGKSPTTAEEIQKEMSKPKIFDDLGLSLHREKGVLYDTIDIQPDYVNCFFSSKKSIELIKENVEEKDRFFLMDGTFKITPKGFFQQVLIIYVQFGIRVCIQNDKQIFFIGFSIFSFNPNHCRLFLWHIY